MRSIRFRPKPAQGLAPLKAKNQNDITSTCAQNGSSTGRFFGRKIRPKETSLRESKQSSCHHEKESRYRGATSRKKNSDRTRKESQN
jgi:hypothetical protein